MVIHHDKMAYGKLASLTEKLSDERLAKMAKMLSDGQNEEQKEEDGSGKKPSSRVKSKNKRARLLLRSFQLVRQYAAIIAVFYIFFIGFK